MKKHISVFRTCALMYLHVKCKKVGKIQMFSLGIWTERNTYSAFDLTYSAKQFLLIEKIIKEQRAVWKYLTHTHIACLNGTY